jgi:hypothetical protein
MKNMIRVGSASYLVLLIKYWKGLLLESASEKAMVYVDDNTFRYKGKRKGKKGMWGKEGWRGSLVWHRLQ